MKVCGNFLLLPSATKQNEFSILKGYQRQNMKVGETGVTNQQAEMINSTQRSNDGVNIYFAFLGVTEKLLILFSRVLTTRHIANIILPGKELNPGLLRDKQSYLPLYFNHSLVCLPYSIHHHQTYWLSISFQLADLISLFITKSYQECKIVKNFD